MMQKGEWKKRAEDHRRITGSGFMCPCFRQLVTKNILELIEMEIELDLMTKKGATELIEDIRQLVCVNPSIELRRILIAEIYQYATELDIKEHWYELYRDELEEKEVGFI